MLLTWVGYVSFTYHFTSQMHTLLIRSNFLAGENRKFWWHVKISRWLYHVVHLLIKHHAAAVKEHPLQPHSLESSSYYTAYSYPAILQLLSLLIREQHHRPPTRFRPSSRRRRHSITCKLISRREAGCDVNASSLVFALVMYRNSASHPQHLNLSSHMLAIFTY